MARPPAEIPKTVTVEDMEAHVPEPTATSGTARNEEAMFAHEQTMQKSNLGWVGAIWGSRSEKPGNVAAIVLLLLLIFVGAILFNHKAWGDLFSETLALMMSTVTLILGYLFGSSSNRD